MPETAQTAPERDAPPVAASGCAIPVRLVAIPALLVSALVGGIVAFGWLTFAPADVDSLVDGLGREGNPRWRAAVALAGMLSRPGNESLKRDRVLARRLIEALEREIEAGGMGEAPVTLRIYLCRALGELHLSAPTAVLIEAAATERDPREADVRRSAIEAMAVLASNLDVADLRSRADWMGALTDASGDRRSSLRSAAAFALGVTGGAPAEARLETMLSDPYPDVRYNAATGLARHGNARAIAVLCEMLDPHEAAGVAVEQQHESRQAKRAMILANALRAAVLLAASNPDADLAPLREAVERLVASDVHGAVRAEASEVLRRLEARRPR
jgi:hypothetical protein